MVMVSQDIWVSGFRLDQNFSILGLKTRMKHRFPGALRVVDSEAWLNSLRDLCKRRLVYGIRPVRLMYSHSLLWVSKSRDVDC